MRQALQCLVDKVAEDTTDHFPQARSSPLVPSAKLPFHPALATSSISKRDSRLLRLLPLFPAFVIRFKRPWVDAAYIFRAEGWGSETGALLVREVPCAPDGPK